MLFYVEIKKFHDIIYNFDMTDNFLALYRQDRYFMYGEIAGVTECNLVGGHEVWENANNKELRLMEYDFMLK